MAARDIVVIGASAGGVTTIRRLLSNLPSDFKAVAFVALHRSQQEPQRDYLADILAFKSPLRPRPAVDGQRFTLGEIYVAPADTHLLVQRGVIRLERSPKESRARPSVDALFRSAAAAYGRRVVGVVLSGLLGDGSVGLWQIRKHGGIAIAQDPDEAIYPDMPQSAVDSVPLHYCLRTDEIARVLVELTSGQPQMSDISGSRPARLLIVEDERIVAQNLANRLRERGYTIVGSVATGEDAIAAAASEMPDLVLMDVSLEGKMRGTEAAAILWERFQLPVVYLTAHSDEQTLNAAKLSMPFGFVVKPYHPAQVHAAIQLALDRYCREMDVSAPAI
jgi:chemotaxis response regulator CheB